MSVQQLSSSFVKKMDTMKLSEYIESGKVDKKGGKYYVAGKNVNLFPENAYVTDGNGNLINYHINVKGAYVETTTQKETKGEVVDKKTEHTVALGTITSNPAFPKDMEDEFKQFIAQREDVTLDENGNLTFNLNDNALNKVLNEFANMHPDKFVNKSGDKYITFTEDSDQGAIQNLAEGDNPAITNVDNRYKVSNREALDNALTERIGDIQYEPVKPSVAHIDAGVTTTTTTKENVLNVPDDLKNNKKGREKLEQDAQKAYEQFAADPENRYAVDLYVAENRYTKQIDKKMAELSEYKTTMGGTKEKKASRDAADIVQYYVNNYADANIKSGINVLVKALKDSTAEEDKQAILNELQQAEPKIIGVPENYDQLPESLKEKGALLCVAKASGYDANTLLRLMATQEVMKERTTEQIKKDDKYFIKHQAEDYVKNRQADQDVKAKNLTLDDLGKYGTDIVKACPEMLCDEVKGIRNSELDKYDKATRIKILQAQGYVEADVNGEKKIYKFNQDKWKTFMGICCDPSKTSDAELAILFGENEDLKTKFMTDLNMTLREGRSVLEMQLPSPYGESGTLKFENIIGNNNGKISNNELQRLINLQRLTGYSADTNYTKAKRLGHVALGAAEGAAMAAGMAGIGTLFGNTVAYAGQTASQMVPYVAKTEGQWVDYSGQTEGRYQNFQIEIDGRQATVDFTTPDQAINVAHDVNVDMSAFGQPDMTIHWQGVVHSGGKTYPVTLTIDPETQTQQLWVDGQEYNGKKWVDGQEVSGETKAPGQDYSGEVNTAWQQIGNAAKTGGIIGGITSILTMGGVHDKGRGSDDVYDLTKYATKKEIDQTRISIDIPQFNTVETRRGEMAGGAAKQYPAVKYRGPEAYNVLYKYEDGTPVNPRDFAKAYQAKIGGDMSRKFFYVFTDLVVNGKKLVPVDDLDAQYAKITEGTPGTSREVDVKNIAQKRHVQGTIR